MILIVADHAAVPEPARRACRAAGLRVAETSSPARTLALASTAEGPIVLLLGEPETSVLELVRSLDRPACAKGLIVLGTCGLLDLAGGRRIASRLDAALPRPVDGAELLATISALREGNAGGLPSRAFLVRSGLRALELDIVERALQLRTTPALSSVLDEALGRSLFTLGVAAGWLHATEPGRPARVVAARGASGSTPRPGSAALEELVRGVDASGTPVVLRAGGGAADALVLEELGASSALVVPARDGTRGRGVLVLADPGPCLADPEALPIAEVVASRLALLTAAAPGRDAEPLAREKEAADRSSDPAGALEESGLADPLRLLAKVQEVGKIGWWVAAMEGGDELVWSPETYRIFGRDPGDAISVARFFEQVHPDDRAAVRAAVARAVDTRTPYSIDHRIVLPGGSVRWVHERGDVVRDEGGRPDRLVGVVLDLTEEREAELRTRDSEARWRQTLDASADIIFVKALGSTFQWVNKAFVDFFGLAQPSNTAWQPRTLWADAATTASRDAEDRQVFETGKPLLIPDQIIRTREGKERHFQTVKSPILDSTGSVVALVGIARDVTETRANEAALRASEELLRQLTETIDQVFWMGSPRSHDVLYVSPAFERVWGRPRQSLYDDRTAWHSAIVAEDQARVHEALRTKLLAGHYDERYRIERPDGSRRWIRDRAFPVRDAAGEIIRIAGIAEDVTDLVGLEQQLALRARQQAAVAAFGQRAVVETDKRALEEEALRVLTSTLGVELGTVLEALPGGRELRIAAGVGYRTEIVGATIPGGRGSPAGYSILAGTPVVWEDMARETRFASTWVMRELGVVSGVTVPVRGKRGLYGALAALSTRARPYTEDDVNFAVAVGNVLAAAIDRRGDEEALHRSEERLRQAQKMEAIGRLAGGIAHDFNNLLTAILGYSELTTKAVPPGSVVAGNVAEIFKAGTHAQSLTRQLLALSRRRPVAPRPTDVGAVVADMSPMLQRLIGEDVELSVERAPGPAVVLADDGQLEQVVLNLVVNARDAMPGGGRLRVATSVLEPGAPATGGLAGGAVVLTVTDTGAGIDEATKARLFEPFFTTKEPGKGTGLGLSTVYGIVKQGNGSIDVESAPGRGATFRVALPRLTIEARGGTAPAEDEVRGGRETVLLVEDDEVVRRLGSRALASRGYTVLEAGDGVEALALLERQPGRIDLVVTDVVMPRMGGIELAGYIRRRRPGTRILFVSGYTGGSPAGEERLDTGTELLEKPFTPDALARRVRERLDATPGPR